MVSNYATGGRVQMWTNATSNRIHAKTELVAPTHTGVIRAPVVTVFLERTVTRTLTNAREEKEVVATDVSIPLEVIIAHVQVVFDCTTGGDAGIWTNAPSEIRAKTEPVAQTHKEVIRATVVAVFLERTVTRTLMNV